MNRIISTIIAVTIALTMVHNASATENGWELSVIDTIEDRHFVSLDGPCVVVTYDGILTDGRYNVISEPSNYLEIGTIDYNGIELPFNTVDCDGQTYLDRFYPVETSSTELGVCMIDADGNVMIAIDAVEIGTRDRGYAIRNNTMNVFFDDYSSSSYSVIHAENCEGETEKPRNIIYTPFLGS